MKKCIAIGLLLVTCLLCGCSSTGSTAQTKGTIDCYSIKVESVDATVFSAKYYYGYAEVYEYKSSNGDSIYTNYHITDFVNYIQTDAVIYVYNDRYTNEYTEYSYVGFIGWLAVKHNYYLDLDNKMIDSETKWSKYLYESNPNEEIADNKKAYKCAKQSYYQVSGSCDGYNSDGIPYYALWADLMEKDLERHTYTKLGEDCVITYTPKWFD